MLARTLLLSLLLFIQLQGIAQEEREGSIIRPQARRLTIKATLSDLVWAADGILPIAIEYKPYARVGITGEIGIPLFYTISDEGNYKGKTIKNDIRVAADLRSYFYRGNPQGKIYLQNYVGFHASYRAQNYSLPNGANVIVGDGSEKWIDSGDVFKQVYKANIIIGVQIPFSRRLFMSLQGGLGIKNVRQDFKNEGILSRASTYTQKFFTPIRNNEDKIYNSSVFFLNLPVAIRLCYAL